MNKLISSYDINIHGLEDKSYEYSFEGSDDFFKLYEQDIIDKGIFNANVFLDKSVNVIRLKFNIIANIDLECDRSLENFTETFNIEEKYIYKFGEKAEVVSDELETIPFGTSKINVAELIFDYILLQIPIKKLHPRFRNTDEGDENGVMVYSDEAIPETVEEDPRWAALKKLKDLEK